MDNKNSADLNNISGRSNATAKSRSPHLEIGSFIDIMIAYKKMIMAIIFVALLIGIMFAIGRIPVYRANALIQIDEKDRVMPAVMKDNYNNSTATDSSAILTQTEVITSRSVLERVVSKLHLDVSVEEKTSFIGKIKNKIFDLYAGPGHAKAASNLKVSNLVLPERLQDKALNLQITSVNSFRILDQNQNEVLTGMAGVTNTSKEVEITIANETLSPGASYTLIQTSLGEATRKLRERLSASEKAKRSGILEIGLIGSDKQSLESTLNEILDAYQAQSISSGNDEIENQILTFQKQIPSALKQVESAENAYSNYRKARSSVDVSGEADSFLKAINDIEEEQTKVLSEREDLRQRFTPEHPRLLGINDKLQVLNQRKLRVEQNIRLYPEVQQTNLRLKRDLDVASSLYLGILNAIQQLRANRANVIGVVKVVDRAKTSQIPIEPKKSIIVVASLIVGIILSMIVAALRHATRKVIDTPSKLQESFDIPILACIPHSRNVKLKKHTKSSNKNKISDYFVEIENATVESLLHLRVSVENVINKQGVKSIVLGSSRSGVGKSFLSTNLAILLAKSGKRVVLVDCDLRKGTLHDYFNLTQEHGLSEYLRNEVSADQIIKSTDFEKLKVVSRGQNTTDFFELLSGKKFLQFRNTLNQDFDVIIFDTPPVLAVADALKIADDKSFVMLVVQAGVHPATEIAQTISRFESVQIHVGGLIFNNMNIQKQHSRFGNSEHVYSFNY